MTGTFRVKTKVGDEHTVGGKYYVVIDVKKVKDGWRVRMVRK